MLNKDKKLCSCYVSKNHLMVILLSHLKKIQNNRMRKLGENKNIFTNKEKIDIEENNGIFELNGLENITLIFEEDFSEEIKKVSNVIKFPKNKKQDLISNLNDCLNNDLNELSGLVIIQGSYEFIQKVNYKLDNNKKVVVINCFKFQEFEYNISEILRKHSAIINTLGVRSISKIFNRQNC